MGTYSSVFLYMISGNLQGSCAVPCETIVVTSTTNTDKVCILHRIWAVIGKSAAEEMRACRLYKTH